MKPEEDVRTQIEKLTQENILLTAKLLNEDLKRDQTEHFSTPNEPHLSDKMRNFAMAFGIFVYCSLLVLVLILVVKLVLTVV